MVDLITPEVVERMYRDLARFQPSQKSVRATAAAKKVELTRADVDAIIRRTRVASPEELQHIISRKKEFSLTNTQRDQLAVDLTIVVAQRQVNRRDDPSAEFISKVLGYTETPYGLIEREWMNAQLRAGSQSIQRCKDHRPPDCACWSASRATLWQARANGEKSPEGWAASRIYDFFEALELATRSEAGTGEAR